MEDNIKPYSAEELNTRLDRVNSWIDNCDQKASILLAFAGALAAVLLTSDILASGHERLVVPFVNYWNGDKEIPFSFSNLVIFLSLIPILYHVWQMVVYLLLVLKPKTKIEEFGEGVESSVFSWQIERKCVILQANNSRICNRYVNKLFSKRYAKY